ncbi:hypothetical protein BDB01DRAFT_852832 [Pilobolus umbonatus]|nr:hypothetical protein BDB01DRAFT_852832 [Pilobolus umbonatus]
MSNPDKKRRLDEPVVSTPSRPPLKKRFTSSMNLQQEEQKKRLEEQRKEQEKKKEHVTLLDAESYTKDDLLQNMRDSKHEAEQLENKYKHISQVYYTTEAEQSLLRIDWNLIQSEIVFITKMLVGIDIIEPQVSPAPQLTLNQEKEWCYENQLIIKELATKALTRLESWSRQVDLIERKFRMEDDVMLKRVIVSDWLKNDIDELKHSYQRGLQVIQEIQQRLDPLVEDTEHMKSDIKTIRTDLHESLERLDECIQDLKWACRRKDRAESKVVAALSLGGLGDMTEMEEPVQEIQELPNEGEPEGGSLAEQAIKTQLAEHKLILVSREKEIEDLKRDRQTLLQDEERLLSMFALTDERLLETEYIKNLQLSIEHYRNRCQDLEQLRNSVERDMDKISSARQQLIDQLKSEKMAQSITMETEMRRLENDLTRIRTQRDHFQTLIDDHKAKESREKEGQEKIVSFAVQGKQRIESLESRIQKLKHDQDMAGPFEKESTHFIQLKEQLSHLHRMLSHMSSIPSSVDPSTDPTLQWKSHPTIQSYDQYLSQSNKLSLMVDFYEKNEKYLLQQIDEVDGINGKLEEQHGKKVFDLTQRKEQVLKLQAEKSKYAQTFGSLISAKEKQLSTVTSLKITKEKQQDLIKQLEEKEKALEIQVLEKESQIRKLNKAIQEDRMDLEDVTHLCNDYRSQLEQNEMLMSEVQKILKEKSKLMDEEKQHQVEIEENYEKMKKKWDKISQGDNPAEQQLAKECEDLRALLKCSTCRTRFRTHILTRCMHTFCKNCIDARLETRQRRCPTCSEPFGASDILSYLLIMHFRYLIFLLTIVYAIPMIKREEGTQVAATRSMTPVHPSLLVSSQDDLDIEEEDLVNLEGVEEEEMPDEDDAEIDEAGVEEDKDQEEEDRDQEEEDQEEEEDKDQEVKDPLPVPTQTIYILIPYTYPSLK